MLDFLKKIIKKIEENWTKMLDFLKKIEEKVLFIFVKFCLFCSPLSTIEIKIQKWSRFVKFSAQYARGGFLSLGGVSLLEGGGSIILQGRGGSENTGGGKCWRTGGLKIYSKTFFAMNSALEIFLTKVFFFFLVRILSDFWQK